MTDRERAGLAPCPFCGGTGIEIQSNGIGDFYAICLGEDDGAVQCGARSGEQHCETRDGAAWRWNRRAYAQKGATK